MKNKRRLILIVVLAAVAAVVGTGMAIVMSTLENPDALWSVVQSCVEAKKHGHTLRAGCLAVDPSNEVAILPGIIGRYHYLAVPTIRMTGIEDPQVKDPHLPNYWELAWSAAYRYFPKRVTANRADIGLAINSKLGRTQNQLHIHIACLRADIRRELRAHESQIGPSWSKPILQVGPQDYRIMRVQSPTLDGVYPFLLLLKVPQASANMAQHTLVVTGATWDRGTKAGFYILDDAAHDTDNGPDLAHGEDLLDENCHP